MTETELGKLLLKRLPFKIPTLRLFRRQVMLVKVEDRKIRSGLKGQADLYGYWRGGQGIEIELKSETAVTTPGQLEWEAFCRLWGVPYLRLRAKRKETPEETVGRWILEIGNMRK